MAQTVKEIQDRLSLSYDQVRDRIRVLQPWIGPYIRRGQDNRMLIDEGAVRALETMQEVIKQGLNLEQAALEVAKQLQVKKDQTVPNPTQTEAVVPTKAPQTFAEERLNLLEYRLRDLEHLINTLKEENARLWEQNEKLFLMLPKPTQTEPSSSSWFRRVLQKFF